MRQEVWGERGGGFGLEPGDGVYVLRCEASAVAINCFG